MNTQTRATAPRGGLPATVTVRGFVSRCASLALDLLYPYSCAGCGGSGEGVLCASCDARVTRLQPAQRLKRLSLGAAGVSGTLPVASGALYETPLREAIHTFKYDGTPALAAPLAPLLLDAWQVAQGAFPPAEVLAPVPLHPRRRRERGYNQSELLAHRLSALCGTPVDPRLLRRVRYTEQQALLRGDQRRRNVQGAFEAAPGARGKRVALVDDVFTTGSTLVECALALLGAGASGVYALTLARAE